MGLDDRKLDGLLDGAFRGRRGGSVLERIERLHGAGSSILLREPDEDPSPVLLRREGRDSARDDSRYQVLGEIARGGIGIVCKARDKDLNRDVALKVLRREYAEREDVIARFVEEAQVGGQLQHPGIVPVYGLGLQPDGRPGFAMKLVKGRTLAALIAENPRGIDLLAVFEQVAQTIAYAHSRGVIHRDVKPANVMVGAFGEVQVVDWGFAKVLGQDEAGRAPDRTVIATVRSEDVGSQSIVGSVMGTPAYMPPEQAMGRIEELDERCDVFALGAILCEILTGKPPYTGDPKDQLVAAAQSRLEPALERLVAARPPEALDRLVRDCLEPLPGDRPRDAGVVARRLTQHLASVEEGARQAEVDALAAETEAARAKHARRRARTLAVAALLLVAAGSGGYLFWKQDRDAREARAAPRIAAALREATGYEGKGDWPSAVAAAQRGVDLAESEGADDRGARALLAVLTRKKREADDAARAAAEDAAFVAELDDIRGRMGQGGAGAAGASRGATGVSTGDDPEDVDAAFAAALAAYEQRVGSRDAAQARLKASPHAGAVAASLAYWTWVRRTRLERPGREGIDRLIRALDPENEAVHDALAANDADALVELAKERGDRVPVALASQIGLVLIWAKRTAEAAAFLQRQHLRAPGDFWINVRLGYAADANGDHARAAVHATAALAARPNHAQAWFYLGRALHETGDLDGALRAYERAVELDPAHVHAYNNLGFTRLERGDLDGAMRALDRALALDPDLAGAHNNLGRALYEKGELDAAALEFRKAIAADPGYTFAHNNLGIVLQDRGDFEGAVRVLRRAIELDPEGARFYDTLGNALGRKGDLEGSIRAHRRAVALDPRLPFGWFSLGVWLHRAGDLPGAIQAYRQSVEVDERHALTYSNLGNLLRITGALDEAVRACEKAIELDPKLAFAYNNLGASLRRKGELDAAVRAFEKAIELDPGDPDFHYNLGLAHLHRRAPDAAVRAFEQTLALAPDDAAVQRNLALARCAQRLPAVLSGEDEPADAREKLLFARLALGAREDPAHVDTALRFCREAFEAEPGLAEDPRSGDRYGAACAASLVGGDAREEALRWLRADLDAWTRLLEDEAPLVAQALSHWKQDADLAPIRDAEDLPEAFRALWADVDALLERAKRGGK